MKVFVFSTHTLWPNHRETELELMQNHLDNGDTVYRFVCKGELPVCDTNPEHSLENCMQCRNMRVCGRQLLEGHIKELPIIHRDQSVQKTKATYFFPYNSIEELKKIYVDNFDIGYAVISSVVSLLREPDPDINKHKQLFDNYFYSSLAIYLSGLQYIKELQPDLIYVFNGRFAHVKPVLRAAQQCSIECLVHERGRTKNYYSLFKNTTPHDRAYVVNQMLELWENASPKEREQTGAGFYEDRLKGKEQGWFSFTKHHEKGLLPENWDESKRNIVIFNSSEDEFASIGDDWKNELYATQVEGIRRIVFDLRENKDIHFYLRVHPNLSTVENSEIAAIKNLVFPNLTIIEAQSPISTYDLLLNCEKVIAFGSSVGIEAVYWGKPSIQAGKSYYYGLNATYKPSSHAELIQMTQAKLEPMGKVPALIYGYYFQTYGTPFEIYKPKDLMEGTYKGVDLSKKMLFSTKVYWKLKMTKVSRNFVHRFEKNYSDKKKSFLFFI